MGEIVMDDILHIVCNICGKNKKFYEERLIVSHQAAINNLPHELENNKIKLWYTDGYPESMPMSIQKRDNVERFSFLNKFYALQDVINLGAKRVAWVDSIITCGRKFYYTLEYHLSNDGTFFLDSPYTYKYFSNDRFLSLIGKNREEYVVKQAFGGLFGFDLNTIRGNSFYNCMKLLSETKPDLWYGSAGKPWFDEEIGHRHDQCVMGYILDELNIPFSQENFEQNSFEERDGMNLLERNSYGPYYYDMDWINLQARSRKSDEQGPIYYPNCCATHHPTGDHFIKNPILRS